MKLFALLLFISNSYSSHSQKLDAENLIGKWRICNSNAAPMVYTFSDNYKGEKGLLKDWSNPSDFRYITTFTYTVTDAPKDSLTGNPAIDDNLFLMTTKSNTLSGVIDIQSFLVHIATKDSVGLILRHGFITRLCRVKE